MVHLILSSSKGNQGLRYFPYSGYLGLTPVKVEGVVRTKLDDDAKLLQAKSITISVRCYESRLGRVSVLHSNILVDHTQVLWTKPDGVEYAPIGELEFPFRISIPARVAGFSTAVFVDYRCMWRVEAVVNHAPISHIGSRQIKHFELPLVRYDLPLHQPTPPPSKPLLLHQTTKPRAPRLRYCINPPTSPIGPLDLVSIPVFLLPMDEGVSIRSATVIIERRIQLNETTGHPSPPVTPSTPSLPIPSPKGSSQRMSPSPSSSLSSYSYSPTVSYQDLASIKFNAVASTASDTSSNPTITPNTIYPSSSSIASDARLIPPNSPSQSASPSQIPSKIITTPVVGAESSGQFMRDNEGIWSKTLTLQWPAAKSHSRWAIGETIHSDLVSVKFFIRLKIVVSSPTGTESIELSDRELLVVSTNEADRELAISKFNEAMYNYSIEKSGRSKSKSPRRTRRDHDPDVPPPPAPHKSAKYTIGSSSTGSVTGSTNGIGSSKASAPRRPHTSAGPRDKAYDFAGASARMGSAYSRERDPPEKLPDDGDVYRKRRGDVRENGNADRGPVRPATSQGQSGETKRRSGKGYSLFSSPRVGVALSGSSTGTSASASGSGSVTASTSRSTSSSMSSHGGDEREDRMREWEEELAKIEMKSRRSSDMLGFAGKRKRSTGAPKIELGIGKL